MSSLTNRFLRWLTGEKTGGLLLLLASGAALIWANTPAANLYHEIAQARVGPASLGFEMSVADWASGGLLVIFFFVVGVELKGEMVTGALSNLKEAAVPVIAAVGGMAIPALIYTATVVAAGDRTATGGWAIPTATDIAFALAVLAIFGKGIPGALRIFLLTLAVVDDLLAIIVIAVFYSDGVSWVSLLGAAAGVVAFGWVARQKWARWWLLIPLALITWGFMHHSGVHTTVAGVALGFSVPARRIHGEFVPRTVRYGEKLGPISAGLSLPVFAFFAAGVTVIGAESESVFAQPVMLAIIVGLIGGKLLGVLGITALLTKFTPLRLSDGIVVRDLLPIAFLTGIGFTVALLIAELSFTDAEHASGAKVGILLASALAAVMGAFMLRIDARRHISKN